MDRNDHENTISLDEFLGNLSSAQNYIAVEGSYSPDPEKSNRFTLCLEKEKEIEYIREAWLLKEESDKLNTYKNVVIGYSDAMYATGSNVVWYSQKNQFKVFEEDKLSLKASKDALILRENEYKLEEIKAIHVYLNGWTEFGIKLVLHNEEILITRQFNEIAAIDFTYDGLNLMADTFWACMLGKDLAKFLDKPCIYDEDLQ